MTTGPVGSTSHLEQLASGSIQPVPGVNTLHYKGVGTLTLAGCASAARTISRTPSQYNLWPRVGLLSSLTTTAAFMTVRNAVPHLPSSLLIGVGGGSEGETYGGFSTVIRFGVGDAAFNASRRGFVGLSAAVLPDANPNTFLNCIGVGHNVGDTNWKLFFGGPSVAGTPVDTGISADTAQARLLELSIFTTEMRVNPDDAGTLIGYSVKLRDLNSFASPFIYSVFSGTTSRVSMPNSTTLLGLSMMRSNAGLSTGQIGIDLHSYAFQSFVGV